MVTAIVPVGPATVYPFIADRAKGAQLTRDTLNTTRTPLLVLNLVAYFAGAVAAQTREDPPDATPAGQFQALVADYAEAQRRVVESIKGMSPGEIQRWTERSIGDLKVDLKASKSFEERRAATLRHPGMLQVQYAELMREVAESAPSDPAAVDALRWCLLNNANGEATAKLADLVIARQGRSERMRSVCAVLIRIVRQHPFSIVERVTRALIRDSPDPDVQGLARVALAACLRGRCNDPSSLAVGPGEPALLDEAKSLLTEVVEKYGDVRGPDSTATLGPIARLELDEIRGREAPVTEGMDSRGMPLRLSDYRGKIVVLSFTSQQCAPCKIEYPRYRDLARRYHDRPLAVLGVYQGTLESLRKEIDSGAIDWPCFWDGDELGPIHQRWHISGWPSLFILDQSGRV